MRNLCAFYCKYTYYNIICVFIIIFIYSLSVLIVIFISPLHSPSVYCIHIYTTLLGFKLLFLDNIMYSYSQL